MYDFDAIIDRKNTNSIKHDFASKRGKPEGLVSLWVADMDFQAPPEVVEALVKCSKHGIFGYSEPSDSYALHAVNWFKCRLGYEFRPEWLVPAPGVVFALNMCIRAFSSPGDSCLIQTPVYYPFASSIRLNGRKVVRSSLINDNGHYRIDFDDFEKRISDEKVKIFILCSPHNPVGRVWSPEELLRMGELALKHNVVVVSDEIHCDFVFPGHKHTIFSSIGEAFAQNSIICTAPSKTFNLAGLHNANTFIPNADLRKKYIRETDMTGISQLSIMGLAACEAAYQYGAPWLDGLLGYLSQNLSLIRDFLKERLPRIKLVEPEGTYLLWLDFRNAVSSQEELERLLVDEAGLWLDVGGMFGAEGIGFARINIASPRSVINGAMERLEKAFG
jgi:cystathionine beta-lyase